VDDNEWLTARFEETRPHLRGVAYRMLGSASEADDAVQEAWLRLHRTDVSDVQNLGGWLTTVVSRVCLDMLRFRSSRRDEPAGLDTGDDVPAPVDITDPEYEAVLADSVGAALLVVLDTLGPSERLAFVLHDMFAVPFDDIASIIGCSHAAARQYASRARRRVQGARTSTGDDLVGRQALVAAFLEASREGRFEALLALLDPDAVLRADPAAVAAGASAEARGATAVAQTFSGRAQVALPALIDGAAGAVWAPGGRPKVVFDFTITGDRITRIDLVMDPDRLAELDVLIL
jgi:RNA polymerase sigma-70 factor (ECF subfamily)